MLKRMTLDPAFLRTEFNEIPLAPAAVLVIDNDSPSSQNKYGRNRFAIAAEKKKWTTRILWEAKALGWQLQSHLWVQLRVYFRDSRRRDADNYSPKLLTDGLVLSGMLSDDTPDFISWLPTILRTDKIHPRTELRLFKTAPVLYHRSVTDD